MSKRLHSINVINKQRWIVQMLLEPMSASSRLLYRLNMIFGSRLRLAGEKRSQYVYIAGYFKTPDKHVKCVSNC